ncbi:CehA/McbA family metallohydrolase [Alicyclobacillus sp.]|uniref:CehA/McbA family metallohydrolase n=1 Tax=Alicyclobacillus sp. TaxID=61169 RepID=UPI0025BE3A8A|nr:CehA/McbA family metallohydrolase [Alicyclobacillus sp.]MCL6517010.1 CehA/McbA family metallohydrolase [Alicyclobacillus sp.]
MWFETHLHTRIGSEDGSITEEELASWVAASGAGGVCLTDHDYVWPKREIARLEARLGCVVIQGVEVSTDLGHVLAFGLEEYRPGIHRIEVLRREIDRVGGVMVLAHPFRHHLSAHYRYGGTPPGLPPWERVLEWPVFRYVDALEACNGSGVDAEEAAVRRVAAELGLPVTGGSDAHRADRLGLCVTRVLGEVRSQRAFCEAVRAGACEALDRRGGGGCPGSG